jgi:hypothetical protein
MTTQADREMLAAPTGKSLVVREEMPQAKSVDNRGVGRHCTHARSSFHPQTVVTAPTPLWRMPLRDQEKMAVKSFLTS